MELHRNLEEISRLNYEKFQTNWNSIIEKYSRLDESLCDEIDINTLTITKDRGVLKSKSFQRKVVGKTKLAVERRFDPFPLLNDSALGTSLSTVNTCYDRSIVSVTGDEKINTRRLVTVSELCDEAITNDILCDAEPSDAETLSSSSDCWETESEEEVDSSFSLAESDGMAQQRDSLRCRRTLFSLANVKQEPIETIPAEVPSESEYLKMSPDGGMPAGMMPWIPKEPDVQTFPKEPPVTKQLSAVNESTVPRTFLPFVLLNRSEVKVAKTGENLISNQIDGLDDVTSEENLDSRDMFELSDEGEPNVHRIKMEMVTSEESSDYDRSTMQQIKTEMPDGSMINEEDLDSVLEISDSSDNTKPDMQQIKTEMPDGSMIDEEDLDSVLEISDSSDNTKSDMQLIETEVLEGNMIDEEDLDCVVSQTLTDHHHANWQRKKILDQTYVVSYNEPQKSCTDSRVSSETDSSARKPSLCCASVSESCQAKMIHTTSDNIKKNLPMRNNGLNLRATGKETCGYVQMPSPLFGNSAGPANVNRQPMRFEGSYQQVGGAYGDVSDCIDAGSSSKSATAARCLLPEPVGRCMVPPDARIQGTPQMKCRDSNNFTSSPSEYLSRLQINSPSCTAPAKPKETMLEKFNRLKCIVGLPRDTAVGTPRASAVGTPRASAVGTPRETAVGTPRVSAVGLPRETAVGTPRASAVGTLRASAVCLPRETAVGTPRAFAVGTPKASAVGTPMVFDVGTLRASAVGTPRASAVGTPMVSDAGALREIASSRVPRKSVVDILKASTVGTSRESDARALKEVDTGAPSKSTLGRSRESDARALKEVDTGAPSKSAVGRSRESDARALKEVATGAPSKSAVGRSRESDARALKEVATGAPSKSAVGRSRESDSRTLKEVDTGAPSKSAVGTLKTSAGNTPKEYTVGTPRESAEGALRESAVGTPEHNEINNNDLANVSITNTERCRDNVESCHCDTKSCRKNVRIHCANSCYNPKSCHDDNICCPDNVKSCHDNVVSCQKNAENARGCEKNKGHHAEKATETLQELINRLKSSKNSNKNSNNCKYSEPLRNCFSVQAKEKHSLPSTRSSPPPRSLSPLSLSPPSSPPRSSPPLSMLQPLSFSRSFKPFLSPLHISSPPPPLLPPPSRSPPPPRSTPPSQSPLPPQSPPPSRSPASRSSPPSRSAPPSRSSLNVENVDNPMLTIHLPRRVVSIPAASRDNVNGSKSLMVVGEAIGASVKDDVLSRQAVGNTANDGVVSSTPRRSVRSRRLVNVNYCTSSEIRCSSVDSKEGRNSKKLTQELKKLNENPQKRLDGNTDVTKVPQTSASCSVLCSTPCCSDNEQLNISLLSSISDASDIAQTKQLTLDIALNSEDVFHDKEANRQQPIGSEDENDVYDFDNYFDDTLTPTKGVTARPADGNVLVCTEQKARRNLQTPERSKSYSSRARQSCATTESDDDDLDRHGNAEAKIYVDLCKTYDAKEMVSKPSIRSTKSVVIVKRRSRVEDSTGTNSNRYEMGSEADVPRTNPSITLFHNADSGSTCNKITGVGMATLLPLAKPAVTRKFETKNHSDVQLSDMLFNSQLRTKSNLAMVTDIAATKPAATVVANPMMKKDLKSNDGSCLQFGSTRLSHRPIYEHQSDIREGTSSRPQARPSRPAEKKSSLLLKRQTVDINTTHSLSPKTKLRPQTERSVSCKRNRSFLSDSSDGECTIVSDSLKSSTASPSLNDARIASHPHVRRPRYSINNSSVCLGQGKCVKALCFECMSD